MKSVVVIVDYFGPNLPEWFPLFLLSCAHNPTINWIIHTDCVDSNTNLGNVSIKRMSWPQYRDHVSKKLDIEFVSDSTYKICDLRAAYGVIWEDEIEGFDFFGWGDIDVIYGDLRHFLTDKALTRNVVSTHAWCLSGHFCLLRNEKWIRNAFRRLGNWRSAMESQEPCRFDEDHLTRLFLRPNRMTPKWRRPLVRIWDIANPFRAKFRKAYLVEQYTTPLVPGLWEYDSVEHSDVWYWREGRVTSAANGSRQFMYLHFMNYVNARWMDKRYGDIAPWKKLLKLVKFDPAQGAQGFRIDLDGFSLIDE